MADDIRTTIDGQEKKAQLVASVSVDADGAPVDFAAAIGSPSDAAWNGSDPDATVISLLKAIATNTSA